MFDVKYYSPEKSIDWLVRYFEVLNVQGNTQFADKFIPGQVASLIFHFKSLPYLIEPVHFQLQPFFIAPIVSKANILQISGEIDALIVACRPTVLSKLFKIDMSPVSTLSIEPPQTIFYPLWEKLRAHQSVEERIAIFSGFLNDFCSKPYCNDQIDILFDKIVAHCIITPLSVILEESSLSMRTIQQSFIKRIGMSPKMLSRIVRVNYLWDKIKHENAIDFQDLVFNGNYYDHAHFIKDFKAITGETPRHFFKRNLKTVKMLSWKATSL